MKKRDSIISPKIVALQKLAWAAKQLAEAGEAGSAEVAENEVTRAIEQESKGQQQLQAPASETATPANSAPDATIVRFL